MIYSKIRKLVVIETREKYNLNCKQYLECFYVQYAYPSIFAFPIKCIRSYACFIYEWNRRQL